MDFENKDSNEVQIDQSKKKEQIDKEFDAILKEFQNMSHQEQGEFIEAMVDKDPKFKELYHQLKSFFQDRVMNLEDYDSHLKLEAIKKHILSVELDTSKNEKITLEPNIQDLDTLKAKFYRTGPDNKLHSKYFTISNSENNKIATINGSFDAWVNRAREYIDNKYQAENNSNSTPEKDNTNISSINEKQKEELNNESDKIYEIINNPDTLYNNSDFSSYKDYLSIKHLSKTKGNKEGISTITLDKEVYKASLKYIVNPDKLAKALGYKEVNKAKEELQSMKNAIQTNPGTADIHLRQKSLGVAEKMYDEKIINIIEKYSDSAKKLNELLKTDIGEKLQLDTRSSIYEENLINSIKVNLDYKEGENTDLSLSIAEKTNEAIIKISNLQVELNQEIENTKNSEYLKQKDYLAWERRWSNEIQKEYLVKIDEVIEQLAKDIGTKIIKNGNITALKGRKFNISLGNGEDVILDFGNIDNYKELSPTELSDAFQNEDIFNDVYINTITDTISEEIFSKKGFIDISGVIVGGAAAGYVATQSGGLAIPAAGATFTVVENVYRGVMYELMMEDKDFADGIDYKDDEDINDLVKNKTKEFLNNTVLFSIFGIVGKAEQLIVEKLLTDRIFINSLQNNIKRLSIKTSVEAGFFTYYSVVSNNIAETIQNEGNAEEYMNTLTDVGTIEDLSKLFAYNLGFISLVKGGGKAFQMVHKNGLKGGEYIKDFKNIVKSYKKLNVEFQKLKDSGYVFDGGNFYYKNNKVKDLNIKVFDEFLAINKQLGKLSLIEYRKAESGKTKGSFSKNTNNPNQKYLDLEKYSKEAINGKIPYTLNDKVISPIIGKDGFGLEGKNIGEGLLQKAGFDKASIKEYKADRLNSKKPNIDATAKAAFEKMEEANRLIYKEYKEGFSKIDSGFSINKVFPKLSDDLIKKLEYINKIEKGIYKVKEKERI